VLGGGWPVWRALFFWDGGGGGLSSTHIIIVVGRCSASSARNSLRNIIASLMYFVYSCAWHTHTLYVRISISDTGGGVCSTHIFFFCFRFSASSS